MNELWERFSVDAQTRLAPKTFVRYVELWRCHAADALGTLDVKKVKPLHLQSLYAELTKKSGRNGSLSARTIHHVHRVLHTLLAWAEGLDLIGGNVARRVTPRKPNASPARALTADEAVALLAAAGGDRWLPFFILALAGGMRRGEIAALKWDAIDFERGMVTVRASIAEDHSGGYLLKGTKTNRVRIVPLTGDAIDALRSVKVRQAREKLAAGARYNDEAFVFADELGRPNLDGATKAFAKVARRAGIYGVTLHSLRHTTATLALSEGSDVRTVAALLGHANPTLTLNTYGHVVAGAQQKAVGLVAGALSAAQARRTAEANGRG